MSEPVCSASELLAALNSRENLFTFLRSKLAWTVDPEETFLYSDDKAVGRAAAHAALSQILPFSSGDPFVIFLVEFTERFRRGDLREILRGVRRRIKEEAAYQSAALDELIFVCTLPDGLRFVHFEEHENRQPRLRVFGYDRETVGETFTLRTVNLPLLKLTTNLLGEVDWKACGKSWLEAWSVEKVTKQFFRDYRDVFYDVKDNHIQNVSGDAQLFVQRFFNRLMFLHFLSKKGWLRAPGTAKEESGRAYLGDLWTVYQSRDKSLDHPDTTFYNRHLGLLFFAALGQPHVSRDNPMLATLVGEVPYLNGGLFEKADDEKGENIAAVIEDAAFQKIWERLFSCYNFTVSESTPDDADVAVDPEMLGKVFEELVTGRHESGSYYTPRPVVQFMCREALKGYLAPCGPGIEALVDLHDASGITNHETVLSALRSVSVVDPACGSGAYLLGMLQELMALRLALFNAKRLDDASAYNRKLEIIQNSIYGVDLDPFAVNTARLRLWLSLVVEDGRNPLTDTSASVALPNLDFKIECGDSVSCPDPQNLPTQVNARSEMIRQFEEKKHAYGDVNYAGNKSVLLAEIATLRKDIAAETPGGEGAFDWRVDFGEVFSGKRKGFDIVLANPPYVRGELIKDLKPTLKRVYGERFGGTMDLYCFFYFRAIELLKDGGQLVFITPNKWFRAGYGAKLRETIAATCKVRSITDFGDLPVFESAIAYPMIFIAQKGKAEGILTWLAEPKTLDPPYPDVRAVVEKFGFTLSADAITGEAWNLTNVATSDKIRHMRSQGVSLNKYVSGKIYRGVLTGFNQAFVIDGTRRAELIDADPNSTDVIKPLIVGKDIQRWCVRSRDQWLIYATWDFKIDNYPAIKEHLLKWKDEMSSRPEVKDNKYPWYCLGRYGSEFAHFFNDTKILYQEIATYQSFALDYEGYYFNNKAFMIVSGDEFLLGLLNSKIIWEFLHDTCSKLQGNALAMQTPYLEQIPIPNATDDEKTIISQLVKYSIWLTKYLSLSKNEKSLRDSLMLSYFEQIISGLAYELYFSDEVHAKGIYLFKQFAKTNSPSLEDMTDESILVTLRLFFETIYHTDHPLRGCLFDISSLEIAQKAGA